MSTPRVSVIVPTCRRAALLEGALASLRAQTLEDWEALVVDDNEPDTEDRREVEEVVARTGDPRIRLLQNDRNRGAQYSSNHGLREACGDWIAILDDDDLWHPEKLARQVALAEESPLRPGFIGCAWELFGESGTVCARKTPQLRGDVSRALELNRIGPSSTLLAKRDLIERVGGFDERLTHRTDIDLYLRLSFEAHFDWCDEVLVRHRVHPNRKSAQPRGRLGAHYVFLQMWRHYIESAPERRGPFYARLGELHMKCGEPGPAARCFAVALHAQPTDLRTLARLALIPLGQQGVDRARRLRRALDAARAVPTQRPS